MLNFEKIEGFTLIPNAIFEQYEFVPKNTVSRVVKLAEWDDIEVPTISDVAEYANVSIETIKKHQKKYDCPLRVYENGQKGRGAKTKFFKASVEHYKEWLKTK